MTAERDLTAKRLSEGQDCFPAYSPPYRTFLGHQIMHVDEEFYDRFYRPEVLTETQREHMSRWHAYEGADSV